MKKKKIKKIKKGITGLVVNQFFDPWPINFPKDWQFKIEFLNAMDCYKMRPCWKNANGKMLTVKETCTKIEEDDWLGMRHTIRSLARQKINNKIIIVNKKNVIFDGNHRINALCLNKYKGLIMVIKQI